MRKLRALTSVLGVLALLAGTVLTAPSASASAQSGIDIYKPVLQGWDSTVGAYKFTVYWTWRKACGSGYYCYSSDGWPFYSGSITVSDPDIVTMAFEDPMSIKKVELRSYLPCSTTVRQRTTALTGPDTGWDNASSQLQDTHYAVLGTCAGTQQNYSQYNASSMTNGVYTVWAQPVSGCNTAMRVRAFYAHSWSNTTIQISGQVPLGVGISASSSTNWWQASNRTDGAFDDDLTVASICRR